MERGRLRCYVGPVTARRLTTGARDERIAAPSPQAGAMRWDEMKFFIVAPFVERKNVFDKSITRRLAVSTRARPPEMKAFDGRGAPLLYSGGS